MSKISAPTTPARYYDAVAVFFVAFLLLSNIGATKLINLGGLVFDGGAVLFPLTYILGDVLAEVYGFARARRTIVLGFTVSIVASVVFWVIIQAPPDPSYTDQDAFAAVLGVVPRFVAASLCGYLVGQLLNAWVLTRIKDRWGQRHLWARLIGSTAVGELADTVTFCVIAWAGTIGWSTILNLMLVGYLYKVAIEVVFLPITYLVIGVINRGEENWSEVNVVRG